MNERTLLGISEAELEDVIERYLARGEQEPHDLDADTFFDALADFTAAPAETTIELTGEWQAGQFVLKPAEPVPPEVVVQNNRISAPGFTFVIRPISPVPSG
ncbi:MAG: hypothetical protein JW850_21855 [Thermoflexales bacterium]|nr:hypothetical protein [Thermoflexales bacterium]